MVRLLVCGFIVDAPGKQTESQATHIFMHTDMLLIDHCDLWRIYFYCNLDDISLEIRKEKVKVHQSGTF